MQYCALSFLRLGVAAFLAVWLITPAVAQQDPQSIEVGGVRITGLPDDWSHHHLIFSNPGTEQEALAKGTYERWLSVVNDPRYVIQQLKRRAPAQGPSAEDLTRIEELARAGKTGEGQNTPEPLSRDDDHLAGQPAGGLAEQPAGGSRDELLEWRHGPDHQHRGVYKDWSQGMDGAAASRGWHDRNPHLIQHQQQLNPDRRRCRLPCQPAYCGDWNSHYGVELTGHWYNPCYWRHKL